MHVRLEQANQSSSFFLYFDAAYATIFFFFSTFSIIHTALAVCIPKKIHSVSVFLFLAFILARE